MAAQVMELFLSYSIELTDKLAETVSRGCKPRPAIGLSLGFYFFGECDAFVGQGFGEGEVAHPDAY